MNVDCCTLIRNGICVGKRFSKVIFRLKESYLCFVDFICEQSNHIFSSIFNFIQNEFFSNRSKKNSNLEGNILVQFSIFYRVQIQKHAERGRSLLSNSNNRWFFISAHLINFHRHRLIEFTLNRIRTLEKLPECSI